MPEAPSLSNEVIAPESIVRSADEPEDVNLNARLFDAREAVFRQWFSEIRKAVRLHITLIVGEIDNAILAQVDRIGSDRAEILFPLIAAQVEVLRQSLNAELDEILDFAVGLAIAASVDDSIDLFDIANAQVFDAHRRAAAEVIARQWVRPALRTVNENLWSAVGEKVEEYFEDRTMGLPQLKRNIRKLTGTSDTSLDWQWERIARTETTRIHNLMKAAEAQAFDSNRLVRWVGPQDSRTSDICTSIKAGNPYRQDDLLRITDNGAPHPNCRHTMEVIPLLDL